MVVVVVVVVVVALSLWLLLLLLLWLLLLFDLNPAFEVADHPEVLRRPGTAPVSSSDWTQAPAAMATTMAVVSSTPIFRSI